jgi:hypothetical protein
MLGQPCGFYLQVIEAIEGKGGDGSEIRIRTIRATGPCDHGSRYI